MGDSFKLGMDEIENGWLVTRPGGKIYKPSQRDALVELRFSIDAIEKELGNTGSKTSTPPQTSKPQTPVGVR